MARSQSVPFWFCRRVGLKPSTAANFFQYLYFENLYHILYHIKLFKVGTPFYVESQYIKTLMTAVFFTRNEIITNLIISEKLCSMTHQFVAHPQYLCEEIEINGTLLRDLVKGKHRESWMHSQS